MWSVTSGSAPGSPHHLLRVGLNYKFRSYSRRHVGAPATSPGLFFSGPSKALPQFARPLLISSCQSLITPGGNSRSPAPARLQASGHISSKALSRRNISLCDTSPASELGHWSAAIFSSSIRGGISLSVVMALVPHLVITEYEDSDAAPACSAGRHKKYVLEGLVSGGGLIPCNCPFSRQSLSILLRNVSTAARKRRPPRGSSTRLSRQAHG